MRTLIYLALLLLPVGVAAQAYEPEPCDCCGDQDLKYNLRHGVPQSLYMYGCGPGWSAALCSSFLEQSERSAPQLADFNISEEDFYDDEPSPEEEEFYFVHDQWTCSYSPINLMDRNQETAWVEGADGHGEGEVVIVPGTDPRLPVQVWNGYGKSEGLWLANARVKEVHVQVLRGRYADASQCGVYYEDIVPVAAHTVTLQDVNGFQPLPVPEFEVEQCQHGGGTDECMYWLSLTIVSVYPGTKWKDTCITEVMNTP